MKKFISDFKEFALKGNIIDMAVGVVIGAAFGSIVSSFVADIITPLLSLLTGNVDLTGLAVVLKPAEVNELGEVVREAVSLTYGNFIQAIINFLIIALSIFIVLKVFMNTKNKIDAIAKKKEEEEEQAEEEKPTAEELLGEIVELLKKDKN